MPAYHIAQLNIARMIAPLDDPMMADFVAYRGPINEVADASPGFVWQFPIAEDDMSSYGLYGEELILINYTVWDSIEALKEFTYKTIHADAFRKRRKWFEKMAEHYLALWWIPAGHIPTWDEAATRLDALRANGETPYAVSFRSSFPAPDA